MTHGRMYDAPAACMMHRLYPHRNLATLSGRVDNGSSGAFWHVRGQLSDHRNHVHVKSNMIGSLKA